MDPCKIVQVKSYRRFQVRKHLLFGANTNNFAQIHFFFIMLFRNGDSMGKIRGATWGL